MFVSIAFICAHKPRQTVCVGFAGRGRVRARFIFLHDTERILARQNLPLIAYVISFTANKKPGKTRRVRRGIKALYVCL